MSRMWPSYVLYNPPSPSGLDKKYRLFLYREANPGRPKNADKPKGRPALFIPGNAGSFGQVRSVASSAHHLFQSGQGGVDVTEVDWWTVDFNEDFSAFHGETMHEQAVYTNEVIAFLLHQYPGITQIPVLGHSMGGIVARLMMLKDNHPPNSVDTIITLSSPHAYPPVPLDQGVERVYDQINSFWKLNAQDTLLISLSGGILDNQLSSEPASLPLAKIWYDNTSLSAFTSSLPALWSGVDHLAMMWCDQLRERVARGVLRIEGQDKTLTEKRNEWRRVLGIEQGNQELDRSLFRPESREKLTDAVSNDALVTTFAVADAKQLHDAFELYTDLAVGLDTSFGPPIDQEAQLRIDMCSGDIKTGFLCRHVSPSAYDLYPPSPFISEATSMFPSFPRAEERYEIPGKGIRRLRVSLHQLKENNVDHVRVERRQVLNDRFIEAGWVEKAHIIGDSVSAAKELLIPMEGSISPSRSVIVPGMDSSLLAYDLEVFASPASDPSCQAKVAPLLRLESLSTSDTQFYPSVRPASHYTLTLHSTSPFMPPTTGSSRGSQVTLLFDSCARISGISVSINWRASIGLLLSRYRTSLGSFPLAVLLLVASVMWEEWDCGGQFPTLSTSLAQNALFLLPMLILESVSLSGLQSLVATFSSAGDVLPLFAQNLTFGMAASSLITNASLAFIFLTSAYGLTLLVSLLLSGLVASLSALFCLLNFKVGYASTDKGKDEILHRPRSSLISFVLLASIVWLMVPVQFVFLVLFLIQLCSTIRSHAAPRSKKQERETGRANQQLVLLNLYFWLLPFNAPALLIWTRNLVRGYFGVLGGSDHNILSVIGFLFVSQISNSGELMQRSQSRAVSLITRALMAAFSVYTLAYGIRYTYSLFQMANLVALWLALAHYRERWTKRQSTSAPASPEEHNEEEIEPLTNGAVLHSNLPNSVNDADILPYSLQASKIDQQELNNDKNEQEDNVEIIEKKQRSRDELLERYLDTLDEYFACKKRISDHFVGGHFQLSKARMQLGRLISFNKDWDARMKAKWIARVKQDGQFALEQVKLQEEKSPEMDGTLIEEKVESSLRRRKGASLSSKEEESDNPKKKSEEGEKKKKVQAFDPLYQFSALPPLSLRQAQSSFLNGLENLIGRGELKGLFQIQRELYHLEEMIIASADSE